MNKLVVFLVTVSLLGFSCKKDEVPALSFIEQRTLDSLAIANFLSDNSIANVLSDCYSDVVDKGDDCAGYVKYQLLEEGTGLFPPKSNTLIEVSYKGRLMDTGVEFDSRESVQLVMSGVVPGWQFVLYDMQEGDSVTMYIPSVYAYGPSGKGDIPANANLIFDVKLHTVY